MATKFQQWKYTLTHDGKKHRFYFKMIICRSYRKAPDARGSAGAIALSRLCKETEFAFYNLIFVNVLSIRERTLIDFWFCFKTVRFVFTSVAYNTQSNIVITIWRDVGKWVAALCLALLVACLLPPWPVNTFTFTFIYKRWLLKINTTLTTVNTTTMYMYTKICIVKNTESAQMISRIFITEYCFHNLRGIVTQSYFTYV